MTTSAPEVAAVCVHAWDIPSPNGPTALGKCRRCGARRVFNNSFADQERTNNSDLFGAPRRSSGRGAGEPAGEGTSDYDLELALGSMRGPHAAR